MPRLVRPEVGGTAVTVGAPSLLGLIVANLVNPQAHLSQQGWWLPIIWILSGITVFGVVILFWPHFGTPHGQATIASPTITASDKSPLASVIGDHNIITQSLGGMPRARAPVALHMLYRNGKIEVHNDGPCNLWLWGIQFNDGPSAIGPEPAIIAPLGSNMHHYLYADVLREAIRQLIPPGIPTDVPLTLFLKNDDGVKYVARFKLRSTVTPTALGDSIVTIEPRQVNLEKKDWPEPSVAAPAQSDPDIKALQTLTKLASRLNSLADETDTPPDRKLGAVAEFVKWSNRNKALFDQISPELVRVTTESRLKYGFTDAALTKS